MSTAPELPPDTPSAIITEFDDNPVYKQSPLRGTDNWDIWRIRTKDALGFFGLNQFITKGCPPEASPEYREQWRRYDDIALLIIHERVTKVVQPHIASARTANEAWTRLTDLYEPQGVLARVHARRKLHRAQWREGDDIEKHLGKLRLLWQEVCRLEGRELSDEDFNYTILESVPESLWLLVKDDEELLKDRYRLERLVVATARWRASQGE